MKIIVLGATGMLGYQVFKTCLERNITVKAVVRNKKLLTNHIGINIDSMVYEIDDIKNTNSLENLFKLFQADYVINCIGIVKQSNLAQNFHESIAINSLLPHQLEDLGRIYHFRLIHISTDCVFDGKSSNYKESDLSNANDLYGKTKYLGEVKYGTGITLRTSIIGHEITNKNIGLVDWFLSQSVSVKGYTKSIFSGLTTTELTKIILDIVIKKEIESGLYQVASAPISKYDLLNLISIVYNKKINIIPSEELIINRSLDGSRFSNIYSYQVPSWPEMLIEMHKNFLAI
jgi:dTDP-4-dehydrorhamnose reductase